MAHVQNTTRGLVLLCFLKRLEQSVDILRSDVGYRPLTQCREGVFSNRISTMLLWVGTQFGVFDENHSRATVSKLSPVLSACAAFRLVLGLTPLARS